MTLTWAWAETSLAMTIGIVEGYAGPTKGHPEPPLSLKKRVACLKAILRDVPILKHLQDEGRTLAMRFSELGRRRHDLVHGAAWHVHEGEFEATGIRVASGNYAVENHRFNQSDTISLTTEIAKLQDDMAVFMLKVANILQAAPPINH
ncbi:hypothetical protein [Rhodoblastus sp.]|uniref:hypothetical protein n=1 Tax=Rhodoblastus sp. TaxID=1962975 RepID=UPI00261BF08E|nr:hypothetical protein [Rhodoblastus sp.]